MSRQMSTVLHPRFKNVTARNMPAPERLTVNDYVSVPTICTHGMWSILELLTLDEKASMYGLHLTFTKANNRALTAAHRTK
jgi:hypothetical protein